MDLRGTGGGVARVESSLPYRRSRNVGFILAGSSHFGEVAWIARHCLSSSCSSIRLRVPHHSCATDQSVMSLPWQHFGYAVWQCCTRPANLEVPIGATWVDYVSEVNDVIEANARRGVLLFEIFFQTNDTVYQFDLVRLVQRNGTTRFERPIRRVFVPMPARL